MLINKVNGFFPRDSGTFSRFGGIFTPGGIMDFAETIILSAPVGCYAGATAIVTGGTTKFRFIINGVVEGELFESPTTFPLTLIEGDEVRAVDELGNLSNILTAVWDPDVQDFLDETDATDTANISEWFVTLKSRSWWSDCVFWMLRDTQNYGSGLTVKASGGWSAGLDGTLMGATVPAWTEDGLEFTGTAFDTRMEFPTTAKDMIATSASIFGVASNSGEENFGAPIIQDTGDGNPVYPSILLNQSEGVIPAVSRGGGTYYQSSRGGAFPAGFSSVAGVFRTTSQANFRNGTLISNETGLSTMDPSTTEGGTINVAAIRRGNGTDGLICPILFISPQLLSDSDISDLHELYKSTIGSGLSLP